MREEEEKEGWREKERCKGREGKRERDTGSERANESSFLKETEKAFPPAARRPVEVDGVREYKFILKVQEELFKKGKTSE